MNGLVLRFLRKRPKNKSSPPVSHGRAAPATKEAYFMKMSFFTEVKLADPSWL